MTGLDDYFQARAPSLVEHRDGKSLLVWGDLGQWLVVDAEAASLLEQFARKRRVGEVLEEIARRSGKGLEATTREAMPVIDALVERGILGSLLHLPPLPEEPLRVANLTFNITNRCNLQCSWCYNPPSQVGEIPVPDLLCWIRAGGSVLEASAAFMILGGEPFLDERRLLACACGARGIFQGEILVSTNGTILSDGTARALAEQDVTVQVSLDSPFPDGHDRIRGSGVFARAQSTARRLVDSGVRTVLSMVMTRRNEEEAEAYFDLAEKIGVQEVRFIPLRRIGRGVAHAVETPDLCPWFERLLARISHQPGFRAVEGWWKGG